MPNGFKITIALEELALSYRLHHVRIDEGEHLQPAFLALNPHGRIPVLRDDEHGIVLSLCIYVLGTIALLPVLPYKKVFACLPPRLARNTFSLTTHC